MYCSLPGSSVHGDSPGKNTRVGCHALLQGIFPTQGSNPGSRFAGEFFTSWATREAQQYWSGEPIPFPGELPHPGIEPGSTALQADSLPTELPGKPLYLWCTPISRPQLKTGFVLWTPLCLQFLKWRLLLLPLCICLSSPGPGYHCLLHTPLPLSDISSTLTWSVCPFFGSWDSSSLTLFWIDFPPCLFFHRWLWCLVLSLLILILPSSRWLHYLHRWASNSLDPRTLDLLFTRNPLLYLIPVPGSVRTWNHPPLKFYIQVPPLSTSYLSRSRGMNPNRYLTPGGPPDHYKCLLSSLPLLSNWDFIPTTSIILSPISSAPDTLVFLC